jgi:hypothetical protein
MHTHNFGKRKIDILQTSKGNDVICTYRRHPANLLKLQLEHQKALQKYNEQRLVRAQ